jgi:hypothetical protein
MYAQVQGRQQATERKANVVAQAQGFDRLHATRSGRRTLTNSEPNAPPAIVIDCSASGGGGGMAPSEDGVNRRWCPSAMEPGMHDSPHPRSRDDRMPTVLLN